jgi:hypothetical protein
MIAATLVTGPSLIVLGLAVVVLVFVMRRTMLRMWRPPDKRSEPAATQDDFEAAEKGAVHATEMLEVRLHEFARDVEGRMLTRMAVLDRLIVDADREIVRLKELLALTNGGHFPASAGGARGGASESTAIASAAGAPRAPDAVVVLPRTPVEDQREAA